MRIVAANVGRGGRASVRRVVQVSQAELRRSGFEHLVSGIVLTGGGAKMEGLIELAEEIFTCQSAWGAT